MEQQNQPQYIYQPLTDSLLQQQESQKQNQVGIQIKPHPIQNNQNLNQQPFLLIQQNQINQAALSELNDINYNFQTQFIKEQNFQEQKVILRKILVLFLIMSVVYIIMINLILWRVIYYEISLFLTLFVFTMWKILIPIGIKNSNRENSKPIVIFVLLIIIQTFLIYALYTKMLLFLYFNYYFEYHQSYYSDFYYDSIVETFLLLVQGQAQILYSIVTIVTIIYLSLIKTEFNVLHYMIIIVIINSVTSIFFKFELFLIGLVYALLLANILLQIKKGRFKLKVNEVVVGVLALNYGFYVPFWTEK